MAGEVATGDGEGLEWELRSAGHPENQQYWEDRVTFVVSRNSVFGSVNVRNVLIQTVADDPRSRLCTSEGLRRVCRTVSAIQASRELSVMPEDEVRTIMRNVVDSHAGEQTPSDGIGVETEGGS